jgi:membrane peptidoglycan carboxypeptidase
VGNDDNSAMKKVTGGMLPAQIWHDYMIAAVSGMPVRNIPTEGSATITLPWQDGTPDYPAQQEHMRDNNAAEPAQDNVHLGHGFWDKLMR